MKYVIVEEFGVTVPILFNDIISHETFKDRNPVSAGFVGLDEDGKFYTYSSSDSLNLSPNVDDAELISLSFFHI